MKKIIFLLIALFAFVSCDLDEKPKKIAEETFYNNAEELEAGVYAIYSQMQRGMRKNIHTIPEAMTDYGLSRGSYASLNEFQGLDNTNIGRLSDIWARLYKAVRDANSVIKYAPKAAQNSSAEEIGVLVGEARFLRAFCYFTLVRCWGSVPLRTEDNLLDLNVPRAPLADIYDLIISDLQEAERVLPVTPLKDMRGRPTQGSVKTVLADIYLHLEMWKEARDKALEVINSKRYSLVEVKVSDDFYNIFGIVVNGSPEEIYYLKYTAAYGNDYANMGHHTQSIHFNNKGNNGLYTDSIKSKFVKEWDYKDLRKSFNFYNYNADFGKNVAVNGSKTTVHYKKFKDPTNIDKYCASDTPLYRYADLLLLYAEAECRVNNGPTNEAVEAVNMVHRRGYGYPSTASSPVDFKKSDYSTTDAFLNLVLKERGYETVFEGKRFFDLKRMGKLAEVIKEARGIDINSKILLFPIPIDEIAYNEALSDKDQNPGY